MSFPGPMILRGLWMRGFRASGGLGVGVKTPHGFVNPSATKQLNLQRATRTKRDRQQSTESGHHASLRMPSTLNNDVVPEGTRTSSGSGAVGTSL